MLHHRKGIALGTSRASPTSSGFDFLIACGEICVVLEQRAGSKSRSDRVSVSNTHIGFVLDLLADGRFLFFSAFARLGWSANQGNSLIAIMASKRRDVLMYHYCTVIDVLS